MSRRSCCPVAIACALLALALGREAGAATINVPADQPTIQAGIDAALDGDTVVVAPGTWNESPLINGRRGLTVIGSGFDVTTVIGPGQGPTFNVHFSSDIRIEGFRISTALPGGDSLTLGGIHVLGSRPVAIVKNLITGCAGNGVVLYGSDVTAWNNAIVQVGDDGFRMERDASVPDASLLVAYNNTIADNRGGSGVGVWVRSSEHSSVLFNNIFYNNDYNIGLESSSSCIHDYNVISTPGTNFFGAVSRALNEPDCDPLFVNGPGLDYHIAAGSCADNTGTSSFNSTPAASDDFDDQPRPAGAGYEIGADEILSCAVTLTAPPPDLVICAGDSVDIDAGAVSTFGCAGGTVIHDWSDGAGSTWTTQVITVSPAVTTTYFLTISCASDSSCKGRDTVTVSVETPPQIGPGLATDIGPCTRGLVLDWDPATFATPAGGVYNVYRSEASCADAVTRPPIATGLTADTWTDLTTPRDTPLWYVIEAEEPVPALACTPTGAAGGAAARSCIGPVTDINGGEPPDGVYATLRARHVADLVTMLWPLARPLLAGEHFHLLKTTGHPTSAWVRVTPEGDLSREHAETDLSSWIQFFDLRVANACETESLDEYPPGYDFP